MHRKMINVLNELVPETSTAGELVRALRKREGLTLEELGEITGIHDNNLSAVENGRIEVSRHYAEVFAVALDVHPMIFLYPNGKFEKTAALRNIEDRAARHRKRR